MNKGERSSAAHCEGGAVFTFPAALGREPAGAKRAAGDQRTPEGDYRVAGPARPSRFHRFLPIDYPSVADADVALAEKRISRADHAPHRRGAPARRDAAAGHAARRALGFHGEGARWRGESEGSTGPRAASRSPTRSSTS